MDADGSGQITITEFERPAKRLGPNRLTDPISIVSIYDITFLQPHLSNMYANMEDKHHKSKHQISKCLGQLLPRSWDLLRMFDDESMKAFFSAIEINAVDASRLTFGHHKTANGVSMSPCGRDMLRS